MGLFVFKLNWQALIGLAIIHYRWNSLHSTSTSTSLCKRGFIQQEKEMREKNTPLLIWNLLSRDSWGSISRESAENPRRWDAPFAILLILCEAGTALRGFTLHSSRTCKEACKKASWHMSVEPERMAKSINAVSSHGTLVHTKLQPNCQQWEESSAVIFAPEFWSRQDGGERQTLYTSSTRQQAVQCWLLYLRNTEINPIDTQGGVGLDRDATRCDLRKNITSGTVK